MARLGQAASFTLGRGDLRGNWNAQNCRALFQSIVLSATCCCLPSRGSGAPNLIHIAKSFSTAADNFPVGGICKSPSCRRAFSSKLSLGLPATSAGPDSPPLSSPALLSSRRPALSLPFFFAASEWHRQQC